MKLCRQPGLAAVFVPLLFASPLAAQVTVNNSSDRLTNRLGPSYSLSSPSRSDYIAPGGGIFPEQASGLSLTQLPVVKEEGSAARRSGLVGSWEVGRDVNLGLGLFRVTRYSHDEEEAFHRVQPMKDVRGADERLAAIGLSLRF